MNKKKQFIKGISTVRRTETDYMAGLLESVTLDDWKDIIASTVEAAKAGDSAARNFLAQYLVGRPEMRAPEPVTVVVQQLSGHDPVVERLARPHISRAEYPGLLENHDLEEEITAKVAAELAALD